MILVSQKILTLRSPSAPVFSMYVLYYYTQLYVLNFVNEAIHALPN